MSVRFLIAFLIFTTSLSAQEVLPDGTNAALKAIKTLSIPSGMKMELFAAAPKVQSPIAICLDEQGRVYVVEEYRFNRGTAENRSQAFLLEDDLQIDSLEGRLAMFRKHADKLPGGMKWFTNTADQVRILQDNDGDGRADMSKIFAGDFNDVLDGLAAGIIARDGDVYLTNIPHLWLLKDTDGDNVADVRKPLHRGFGVNAGFLGHDLHGLVWGPDGKLYFSVGDRGFNVTNHEGEKLVGPRRGAVFRCDPDGANLEVVHVGLRNPQELAFDEFGNLFAADNNCDKGDLSRLVYVVEGGDSGWNMAFQTIPDPYLTGPWHAEKLWYVSAPDQPAWVVPPVGALGAGPCGFTYYPGIGLDERYDGHFFMCNYTGNGGIDSFAVKPKGAGFEIVDDHHFLTPMKATDVDFGYDGKMYISDFVNLDWSGKSLGGRIYTLFQSEFPKSDMAKDLASSIQKISSRDVTNEWLLKNLSHADMRVRLRSQFELARRGDVSIDSLTKVLGDEKQSARAKRHAIWALGQIGRKNRAALAPVRTMLTSQSYDLREQAVRVLGDAKDKDSADQLLKMLENSVSPRLDFFVAMALGKLREKRAINLLYQLIRENGDRDPFIRHAAVMALLWIDDKQSQLDHITSNNAAERLATLLVLRRKKSTEVLRFLYDTDSRIVTEAARAINDLPIERAQDALAQFRDYLNKLVARQADKTLSEPLIRRVINANFRLGEKINAQAMIDIALQSHYSMAMRREALACLGAWTSPGKRDRVTGEWRPLKPRDPKIAREVVGASKDFLLSLKGELVVDAIELLALHNIQVDTKLMTERVTNRGDSATRMALLRWLAATEPKSAFAASAIVLQTPQPGELRAAAREVLAKSKSDSFRKLIGESIENRTLSKIETQRTMPILASLNRADADQWIVKAMDAMIATGKSKQWEFARHAELEIVEAAAKRNTPEMKKRLETYRQRQSKLPHGQFSASLLGGDASRGEALFRTHRRAQCLRCHKARGFGGEAGPDLTKVASRGDRDFLLQSIVDPNAKLAKGFATISVITVDGRVISGVLESETDEQVVIKKPDGKIVTIKAANIDERTSSKSAMPDVVKLLTPHELRDLVEFLSTLK